MSYSRERPLVQCPYCEMRLHTMLAMTKHMKVVHHFTMPKSFRQRKADALKSAGVFKRAE